VAVASAKIINVSLADRLLYGQQVRVERHWWNGDHTPRGRRDVYIRTDGESWEVEARAGGGTGRSKIYPCPGRKSAEILAGAWMGGQSRWRVVAPS
jgi:hypothetical protein